MLEAFKYGLAGVLNTAVGYAIFWCGYRYLGFSPAVANTVGYVVALALSYCLNVLWVFSGARRSSGSVLRFLLAFAVSFLINQSVLYGLATFAHVAPAVAQLFAMASYTVTFFLLSKFFVYSQRVPEQS